MHPFGCVEQIWLGVIFASVAFAVLLDVAGVARIWLGVIFAALVAYYLL
jgi:hypothetical protein